MIHVGEIWQNYTTGKTVKVLHVGKHIVSFKRTEDGMKFSYAYEAFLETHKLFTEEPKIEAGQIWRDKTTRAFKVTVLGFEDGFVTCKANWGSRIKEPMLDSESDFRKYWTLEMKNADLDKKIDDFVEGYSYNIGCAIKYLIKAGMSNQREELELAKWHIEREIKRIGG